MLLLSLMGAAHEEDWNQHLARLIEIHATPIIERVIRRKLTLSGSDGRDVPAQDEEDVHGEVVVQLVARLSALKVDRANWMIADFRGYVAVVAFNACHHYLRRKYPERWRLKNRVRYVLTHHPPFALWESADEEGLCGLAAWRAIGRPPLGAARLQPLHDLSDVSRLDLKGADARHVALPILLAAIFDCSQAPIHMNELVNTVAALQGVTDQPLLAGDDAVVKGGSLNERLPDQRSDVETELENRSYLMRVWAEIVQLPLPQRVALLLNLRDSQQGRARVAANLGRRHHLPDRRGRRDPSRRVCRTLERPAAGRRSDRCSARRHAATDHQPAEGRAGAPGAANEVAGGFRVKLRRREVISRDCSHLELARRF